MAGVIYGYNPLGQLTQISSAPGEGPVGWTGSIVYGYDPSYNNGRIKTMTDSWGPAGIGSEMVTYSYDDLSRVTAASSSAGWSAGYGHDGFGNLVSKTGVEGPFSVALDDKNRQISPFRAYDANGNQTQVDAGGGLVTAAYDIENRLVSVGADAQYGYDSANKRVYKKVGVDPNAVEEIHFFGVVGRRIAV